MEAKVCYTCKKSKSVQDFYQYPSGEYYYQCRACRSKYAYKYYTKNKARYDEREKTEENRARHREYSRQYRQKNYKKIVEERKHSADYIFKYKARHAIHNAVYRGSLKKPKICSKCNKHSKIEAHHYKGYDKINWFNIIWLCPLCHAGEH